MQHNGIAKDISERQHFQFPISGVDMDENKVFGMSMTIVRGQGRKKKKKNQEKTIPTTDATQGQQMCVHALWPE